MGIFSFLKRKNKQEGYTCPCCGEVYYTLPLCFGTSLPGYYFSVPPAERDERVELKESLCIIDKEHFFHRGRITIPIIDHEEDLAFDVWASISAHNFGIRMDVWDDPKRVDQEPYFGWLQNLIPTYGDTVNIKTIAIEQEPGNIPVIIVIEEAHPLKTDQENGISYSKAVHIVETILRKEHQGIKE